MRNFHLTNLGWSEAPGVFVALVLVLVRDRRTQAREGVELPVPVLAPVQVPVPVRKQAPGDAAAQVPAQKQAPARRLGLALAARGQKERRALEWGASTAASRGAWESASRPSASFPPQRRLGRRKAAADASRCRPGASRSRTRRSSDRSLRCGPVGIASTGR